MAKKGGKTAQQPKEEIKVDQPCRKQGQQPLEATKGIESSKKNECESKIQQEQKGLKPTEEKQSACACPSKSGCKNQTCHKKDNKEKSLVPVLITLFMLMISTAIQFVYFITQSEQNFGFSFFDRVKAYFNGHQEAFIWLRFATAFTLATEIFAVAFKLMSIAIHIGCFVNRIILGVLSFLIVPLTIAGSLMFIINYFPNLVPTQVKPFTTFVPKIPDSIKARINPAVAYVMGPKFNETVANAIGKVVQMFGNHK
eukprot:gnl/Chilomastix_caulleri/414.p1 GENE.gnl/Chilomastix_caulleri/414~~gnl/Chilomastix_caulleri/414.p1  ORF type:complete len:255 (+),score=64.89 gnl/Chilomastix_caulleri/414:61-825(+)